MLEKALMVGIIPDAILDVRGEICPIPLIRTKKQIDQMARGKILKVVANTPEATQNIDAWTKKSGDKILAVENQGNTSIIYLKKN
ncbi:MAG: sulfurtransferase TusA family protein [Candidatus Methanoperedens sp.]|nr:sulfurtransferase TusA family protein [Candidatus Methanoperedens sp.]